MNKLLQQLSAVRASQSVARIGPAQPQPTILLAPNTARNTSLDVIYTMAVLGSESLLKKDPSLRGLSQALLAQTRKHVNRNTLTKEENKGLSVQIVSFLVQLSPYLLEGQCQQVMEYLLRNYKINVFEAEPLAIIFLQYWNYAIYARLTSNIPPAHRLPYLHPFLNAQQTVNIAFIINTISHTHSLLHSIISYTQQHIRTHHQSLAIQQEVKLGEEPIAVQSNTTLKNDPKRFLLQIFLEFINRRMTHLYSHIVNFILKMIKQRTHHIELDSMIMLLSIRLLADQSVSPECLRSVIKRLIKREYSPREMRSIWDFVMIVWQRGRQAISSQLVCSLSLNSSFVGYLKEFRGTLHMVLMSLVESCSEGAQCTALLDAVGVRVKREAFYLQHEKQYINKLVSLALSGDSPGLQAFLKRNYQYEMAWHKEGEAIIDQQAIRFYQRNFQGITVDQQHTLHFNFNLLHKQVPSEKSQFAKQIKSVQSQIQEGDQEGDHEDSDGQHEGDRAEESKPRSTTLIFALKARGYENEQVNFEEEKVGQICECLLADHYSGKISLPAQQRDYIIQNLPSLYSLEYLRSDMASKQFATPLKALALRDQPMQYSLLCFETVIDNLDSLGDLLYCQLLRISLESIVHHAGQHYKMVIGFFNGLYKRVIRQHLTDSPTAALNVSKLNSLLLRVSEQLFAKTGLRKGKYHRFIHNHSRIISQLIYRRNDRLLLEKGLSLDESLIVSSYLKVVRVYGTDNLYLLNLGLIEELSRKSVQGLDYFIQSVLVPVLKQSGVTFLHFSSSACKMLLMCTQMVDSVQIDTSIDSQFSSGIAKRIIADFYGLIKDKFKRMLIKKIFFFLQRTFSNTSFKEQFNRHLETLSKKPLHKIVHVYSQMYKILTCLKCGDNQNSLLKTAGLIMTAITNLLPLELRLALFEPLLPNSAIYAYLGEQLTDHSVSQTQFDRLQVLLHVFPDKVDTAYVTFLRECLRRKYMPKEELLDYIFNNEAIAETTPLPDFSQLICELSIYAKEQLFPHLEKCMGIIMKNYLAPNDYTLAAVYTIIKNLNQMVEPYLGEILLKTLEMDSAYVDVFLRDVAGFLAPPTLIQLIKETHKSVRNVKKYLFFWLQVARTHISDALTKTFQLFSARALDQAVKNQESLVGLSQGLAEVFAEMALKFNEHELRKILIDYVRWAEAKIDSSSRLPFSSRKVVLISIFCTVSARLSELFTPFFGFIFDGVLKDMANLSVAFEARNSLKRQLPHSDYQTSLASFYLSKCLQSFNSLFTHDKEHEFLDSSKFDELVDPISELFIIDLPLEVISSSLIPCLLTLCSYTTDDYKLKSLNYKILLLLRNKQHHVQLSILTFMEKLVAQVQDRYLIFVNDLVPFLVEAAHSRHTEISTTVKSIIGKIEELSGEKIENYLR